MRKAIQELILNAVFLKNIVLNKEVQTNVAPIDKKLVIIQCSKKPTYIIMIKRMKEESTN